jgi:2-hydroxychromene-2-carboxylate isomerase
MPKTVEIWYDYGSPASHIGYFGLKAVAAETGAIIDHHPMLLGGVFQATGNQSPVLIEAKGKWMLGDLKAHADKWGIPFEMNPHFIFNTMPIMRGAVVALRRDEIERYSDAMFNAVWRDGKNMADPAEIGAVLTEGGFDAKAYMDGVQDQAVKDELKTRTEDAVSRGIFGAPAFFVDGRMWWGQDRLDWVKAALSS